LIDDEDKSLGNKLALNDDEFQKLLDIPGVFRASEAPQPPQRPDVKEIEAINRFMRDNPRDQKAEGGRIDFGKGTKPAYDYTSFDHKINELKAHFKRYQKLGGKLSFDTFSEVFAKENFAKGGDVRQNLALGALAYAPAAINVARPFVGPIVRKGAEVLGGTAFGSRLGDIFFSKDQDDKKDLQQSDDKNNLIKGDGPEEPNPLDDAIESLLIEDAVNRLKQKEMDVTKRDERTKLARDLDLAVTRSGMLEIRKGDYFNERLKTLKDKGVNFDGYFSIPEIANLLGTKSSSAIQSYVKDKNIPTTKKGLYKLVKFNDFLNVYQGTKKRVDLAPPESLANKARGDFLKEVGGSIYNRFKDMRRPQFLPPEVKEVYDKYELGAIEGGHPFPVEFFVKKFGKNNTLQKDRQFDWIYRNKDKLFDKNDLVFQSTEVNKFYKTKIGELKKLYKELAPLVDQYEGKGPVTNEKDINKISKLNLDIMKLVTESETEAKKFIEKSPNPLDLERMSKGGLHGAIFNSETGEVSLYAPGKEAGFVKGSVGEIETEDGIVPGEKLKLAGDYLDIINRVIDDAEDKKIFTDYIDKDLLPRFQKGGGVNITPLPRTDFSNGGGAGADENFATELEYFLTNEDAELPQLSTYKETKNPLQIINDIIDPRNYAYYANKIGARTVLRIAEFAGRIGPATGKLISDLIQKPAFKIKDTDNNYVQDYMDELPPSNIKGTGIFSEFLENITPTSLEKKIGLDKTIKEQEQKLIDRGSTVGPVVFSDTLSLGAEVTAPVFPGLKLLNSFAKARNLPNDKVTQKILEKEIDEVLESQGMDRRQFLQATGAGATVVLAKMLGIMDVAPKAAKVVRAAPVMDNTVQGMPAWFKDAVYAIEKGGLLKSRGDIKGIEPNFFEITLDTKLGKRKVLMSKNDTNGEITLDWTTDYYDMDIPVTITYRPGESGKQNFLSDPEIPGSVEKYNVEVEAPEFEYKTVDVESMGPEDTSFDSAVNLDIKEEADAVVEALEELGLGLTKKQKKEAADNFRYYNEVQLDEGSGPDTMNPIDENDAFPFLDEVERNK